VRDRTIAMMQDMKMGDVRDFRNFIGAVIDKKAFASISEYLDTPARTRRSCRAAADDERGLLHRADADADRRPGYPADVRGDLRAGADALRLSRREVAETLGWWIRRRRMR
jgi:acyl-CoA reductase-like NAD-dependent aldehyde dehydrogenase